MTESFTVEAENYVSHFNFLSDNLIQFDRIHRYHKKSLDVDTMPRVWTLAVAQLRPNQIRVPTDSGFKELLGPTAVFMPPFSPVQWRNEPTLL